MSNTRIRKDLESFIDDSPEIHDADWEIEAWAEEVFSYIENIYGKERAIAYKESFKNFNEKSRGLKSLLGKLRAEVNKLEQHEEPPKQLSTENNEEKKQIKLLNMAPASLISDNRKIFIVHGHDNEAKETTARYVEKLGLEAIILHEKASGGNTIIEKFEQHSNVGFAIILLTPDDIGASKDKSDKLLPRARQNVIFELGYFIGRLGRKRVCALCKGDVETPSDYQGIVYIPFDKEGGWKLKVANELIEVGIKIDMNKIK